MGDKRPSGVTLIGYLYIFGAIALMITLFTNITDRLGIPFNFGILDIPENVMRILIAVAFLIMAYGYLALRRWGYWFMRIYTMYILIVSIALAQQFTQGFFYGNLIWSVLVLTYTKSQRKYFVKKEFAH